MIMVSAKKFSGIKEFEDLLDVLWKKRKQREIYQLFSTEISNLHRFYKAKNKHESFTLLDFIRSHLVCCRIYLSYGDEITGKTKKQVAEEICQAFLIVLSYCCQMIKETKDAEAKKSSSEFLFSYYEIFFENLDIYLNGQVTYENYHVFYIFSQQLYQIFFGENGVLRLIIEPSIFFQWQEKAMSVIRKCELFLNGIPNKNAVFIPQQQASYFVIKELEDALILVIYLKKKLDDLLEYEPSSQFIDILLAEIYTIMYHTLTTQPIDVNDFQTNQRISLFMSINAEIKWRYEQRMSSNVFNLALNNPNTNLIQNTQKIPSIGTKKKSSESKALNQVVPTAISPLTIMKKKSIAPPITLQVLNDDCSRIENSLISTHYYNKKLCDQCQEFIGKSENFFSEEQNPSPDLVQQFDDFKIKLQALTLLYYIYYSFFDSTEKKSNVEHVFYKAICYFIQKIILSPKKSEEKLAIFMDFYQKVERFLDDSSAKNQCHREKPFDFQAMILIKLMDQESIETIQLAYQLKSIKKGLETEPSLDLYKKFEQIHRKYHIKNINQIAKEIIIGVYTEDISALNSWDYFLDISLMNDDINNQLRDEFDTYFSEKIVLLEEQLAHAHISSEVYDDELFIYCYQKDAYKTLFSKELSEDNCRALLHQKEYITPWIKDMAEYQLNMMLQGKSDKDAAENASQFDEKLSTDSPQIEKLVAVELSPRDFIVTMAFKFESVKEAMAQYELAFDACRRLYALVKFFDPDADELPDFYKSSKKYFLKYIPIISHLKKSCLQIIQSDSSNDLDFFKAYRYFSLINQYISRIGLLDPDEMLANSELPNKNEFRLSILMNKINASADNSDETKILKQIQQDKKSHKEYRQEQQKLMKQYLEAIQEKTPKINSYSDFYKEDLDKTKKNYQVIAEALENELNFIMEHLDDYFSSKAHLKEQYLLISLLEMYQKYAVLAEDDEKWKKVTKNLGMLYKKTKQIGRAYQAFFALLAKNPEDHETKQLLLNLNNATVLLKPHQNSLNCAGSSLRQEQFSFSEPFKEAISLIETTDKKSELHEKLEANFDWLKNISDHASERLNRKMIAIKEMIRDNYDKAKKSLNAVSPEEKIMFEKELDLLSAYVTMLIESQKDLSKSEPHKKIISALKKILCYSLNLTETHRELEKVVYLAIRTGVDTKTVIEFSLDKPNFFELIEYYEKLMMLSGCPIADKTHHAQKLVKLYELTNNRKKAISYSHQAILYYLENPKFNDNKFREYCDKAMELQKLYYHSNILNYTFSDVTPLMQDVLCSPDFLQFLQEEPFLWLNLLSRLRGESYDVALITLLKKNDLIDIFTFFTQSHQTITTSLQHAQEFLEDYKKKRDIELNAQNFLAAFEITQQYITELTQQLAENVYNREILYKLQYCYLEQSNLLTFLPDFPEHQNKIAENKKMVLQLHTIIDDVENPFSHYEKLEERYKKAIMATENRLYFENISLLFGITKSVLNEEKGNEVCLQTRKKIECLNIIDLNLPLFEVLKKINDLYQQLSEYSQEKGIVMACLEKKHNECCQKLKHSLELNLSEINLESFPEILELESDDSVSFKKAINDWQTSPIEALTKLFKLKELVSAAIPGISSDVSVSSPLYCPICFSIVEIIRIKLEEILSRLPEDFKQEEPSIKEAFVNLLKYCQNKIKEINNEQQSNKVYYLYAQILQKNKQWIAAQKMYEKITEYYPEYFHVKEILAQLVPITSTLLSNNRNNHFNGTTRSDDEPPQDPSLQKAVLGQVAKLLV